MQRFVLNQKKIKSLTSKHKYIDSLIQKQFCFLSVDDLEITDLKKKKLKIRDEIYKLNQA